jgi:uncharacterized tellurite resistance protein B-like protein
MSRIHQALSALRSHDGSAIRPGRPADDALLELLVHMASTDGVFDDEEMALLYGVVPGWSPTQFRALIGRIVAEPIDLQRMAAAWDSDDARWTALRFAARMACRDGRFDLEERSFLQDLADVLNMSSALERVLREVAGPPAERLDPARLAAMVSSLNWGAAAFVPGPVASEDLKPVVPNDATPVVRVGVDHAEVMGIYAEGLVARFLEGVAFLPWAKIVGCTSGTTLESSVRLHTEDGRVWSLVDARMSGVAMLIDRLHRTDADAPTSAAPDIRRVVAKDPTWDDSGQG